ncbi:MAG: SdrD B-like domain-containing protein, partial [Mycobacterium sp.]|nr:SdrD B-like domain-containing protein [Mycobacterium sp.]
AVTLASGGTAVENAGFALPASISGTTYTDNNDNGVLGAGDTDLAGVTVTLLSGTTTVATATTDSSGNYNFTGLLPGNYTVSFTTPGGDTATTAIKDTVSLASGGSAVENAGFFAPATFTATVYTDTNGDGSLDNGETGLAGVTVDLENAGGTIEATAITNSSGNVAFTGLTPGGYEVAVVAPAGDAVTQQTNVTTVNTLVSGGTANAVEGVYVPATITGTAFLDANGDATQDNGEAGISGVTVTLLNASGTSVGTTTTNATGGYSFTGLAPGSYTVAFTTPTNDLATTPISDAVTLASGGTAVENAGFALPASISGTTFTDNNDSGVLGSNPDLGGVTVTLLNSSGTSVGTAVTNATGGYSFTGVAPGSYTVVFTTPGGDIASTPTSDQVTLSAGGTAVENAGFYAPATFTTTVYTDANGDGSLDNGETGLAGVTVDLE